MKNHHTTKCTVSNANFRLLNGQLNGYAFACGYIEPWENGLNLSLDCIYHVKGYINNVRIWETFQHIGDARRYLKSFDIE